MASPDKNKISRYLIVIKGKVFASQGWGHRLFIKALFISYLAG